MGQHSVSLGNDWNPHPASRNNPEEVWKMSQRTIDHCIQEGRIQAFGQNWKKFTLYKLGTKLAGLPRITVGMEKDEVESVLKLMPSSDGAIHCDREQKQVSCL